MTSINAKPTKSRIPPLFYFGTVVFIALLAGFRMASEPEKNLSPKPSNSEFNNHDQITKVRLSATQLRTNLAMKDSKYAQAFISLAQPDKRIEYLHEQSSILSPKDFHMLLDAASSDLSRNVRLEAISLLNAASDSQFRIEYLVAMAQDTDPVVRDVAFQTVNGMEISDRIKVLSQTLACEDSSVVLKSANDLSSYRTKSSSEAIYLQLIQNSSSDTAQKLLQSFERSVGKKFESLSSAASWWRENKNKYNEDLSLVDGI